MPSLRENPGKKIALLELLMGPIDMQDSPDSVEKKLRSLRPQMFHLARRILRDDHLAEDATQEALLELSAYFPRIRDQAAAPSIARRMVIKSADRILRKEKDTVGVQEIGRVESDFLELERSLREIRENLNPSERRLFQLRFEESLTMDAISRELDASIMQTRYQVRQLQKKLQHQIRRQGFKPGDLEMCA